MKILKTRFYLRLVFGLFLILSCFEALQFVVIYFGFTRQIIPRYFQERRDMLLHIKQDILKQASPDKDFDIEKYIADRNRHFNRLKLRFITEEEFNREHDGKRWDSKTRLVRFIEPGGKDSPPAPRRRRRRIEVMPIEVKGKSGYLVISSNEIGRINMMIGGLSFFIFVALLSSFGFGFFLFRGINRKTHDLLEAIKRMSEGDYSARVKIKKSRFLRQLNDEFSLAGEAFNDMASSIEKYTQELKNIDARRRDFIADISHELGTPLTSIKGYLETLRMKDYQATPEEQKAYLNIVWEEAERLSFLVNDLLELARMEAGTIVPEKERIDCSQFMGKFMERNALKLMDKNVKLNWRSEPAQTVFADPRRLEQIFQNLLENALKHSLGIKNIDIVFGVTAAEGKKTGSVIVFKNDGMGIAREHLGRIFERFYKVQAPAGQIFAASGLGLSIAKQLVELHGGTIDVESSPQEGTRFTMTFPEE